MPSAGGERIHHRRLSARMHRVAPNFNNRAKVRRESFAINNPRTRIAAVAAEVTRLKLKGPDELRRIVRCPKAIRMIEFVPEPMYGLFHANDAGSDYRRSPTMACGAGCRTGGPLDSAVAGHAGD